MEPEKQPATTENNAAAASSAPEDAQIVTIVETMFAKKPKGTIVTPDVCVIVLKNKLAATYPNIDWEGKHPFVTSTIKRLEAAELAKAAEQQKPASEEEENEKGDGSAAAGDGNDGKIGGLTTLEYAKETLRFIEHVVAVQDAWREDLIECFRKEAEQDEAARALFKEALIGEAEALANPAFLRWFREREQNGVGAEKIEKWYDSDHLLALTPFRVVVPVPTNMSTCNEEFLADTVNRLMNQPTPFRADFFLPWDAARPTVYLTVRDGMDCISQVNANPELRSVLRLVPRLFLNDLHPFPQSTVFTLRCFVVRGRLLAAEQVGMESGGGGMGTCAASDVVDALHSFVSSKMSPELAARTYVLMVNVVVSPNHPQPCHHVGVFLLAVAPLEPQDYSLFAYKDIAGLMAVKQPAVDFRVGSTTTSVVPNGADAKKNDPPPPAPQGSLDPPDHIRAKEQENPSCVAAAPAHSHYDARAVTLIAAASAVAASATTLLGALWLLRKNRR